jgi:hypothetical protein
MSKKTKARGKPKGARRLLRKDICTLEDTGHTVADIAAMLAKAKGPLENPKALRSLPRESVVIAEKVFQWRFEDVGARDDHILDLANLIAASGNTPRSFDGLCRQFLADGGGAVADLVHRLLKLLAGDLEVLDPVLKLMRFLHVDLGAVLLAFDFQVAHFVPLRVSAPPRRALLKRL